MVDGVVVVVVVGDRAVYACMEKELRWEKCFNLSEWELPIYIYIYIFWYLSCCNCMLPFAVMAYL